MCPNHAPAGIEAEADRLRHPEDHAAGERAAERSHAADDHRLESVQQQRGTVRRRTVVFIPCSVPATATSRNAIAGRERVDVTVVQAHQLRGVACRRSPRGTRARSACGRTAAACRWSCATATRKISSGSVPTASPPPSATLAVLSPPDSIARVGAVDLLQQVLDDDGQAEGHHQRRQRGRGPSVRFSSTRCNP